MVQSTTKEGRFELHSRSPIGIDIVQHAARKA
jgi:hypothetical protein